jgi:hypothetical protein
MRSVLKSIPPAILAGVLLMPAPPPVAWSGLVSAAATTGPKAGLALALPIVLPGQVDSNSPAIWDLTGGAGQLFVMTSTAGLPHLATGTTLSRLGATQDVVFTSHPGNGVWMESVVADDAGTWYGYYHNESPAVNCGRLDRTVVRIGSARSFDHGRTWEDLGIILEADPDTVACDSPNRYVLGGVGDLSVALNDTKTELYVFFSQYQEDQAAQGVAVARMVWANRDHPVGRITVWTDGGWLAPRIRHTPSRGVDGEIRRVWREYPAGTPIWPTTLAWHDSDGKVDAFWGPSVHWNEGLQMWVMLLNCSKDENYGQEGIYVSFAARLNDPRLWSAPQKIMSGGRWYPQVIGLQPEAGTDKVAGASARFFMGGRSDYTITFSK